MAQSSSKDHRWFYAYLPNGMAGGATSPLIPLFTRVLGGSVADVGAVAAASSIASVPAFMGWGNLSDRLHRRKVFVLIGFLGLALTLFLLGISQSVSNFYLANLLAGVLTAASAPVGTVLILETTKQEGWASRIAVFSRVGGIGWIAGLVIGVVWLQVSPLQEAGEMRALFMIGAALALLSAFLAWRWIGEPAAKIERKHIDFVDLHWRVERLRYLPMRLLHVMDFRNHATKAGRFSPALYRYLVTVFLLFSGFTAFYAIFPVYLRDVVGLSNSQVFLVYIASQVASAAAYPRVGLWIHDRGSRRMQGIASAARAVLFPAFFVIVFLPLSPVAMFVAILVLHGLVGLCWAVINVSGSMLASQLATAEGRGRVLGVYNAIQGFGSIAGPLAGGFLAHFGGYATGFAVASVFVVGGVAALRFVRVEEPAPLPAVQTPA
jgi:MFS family permease